MRPCASSASGKYLLTGSSSETEAELDGPPNHQGVDALADAHPRQWEVLGERVLAAAADQAAVPVDPHRGGVPAGGPVEQVVEGRRVEAGVVGTAGLEVGSGDRIRASR